MASSCDGQEFPCSDGTMTCFANQTCECDDPSQRQNVADLKRFSECSLFYPAFLALWVLVIIVSVIGLLFGNLSLWFMNRKQKRYQTVDTFWALNVVLFSVSSLVVAVLEIFANERLMIHVHVSASYIFMHLSLFTFVAAKPVLNVDKSLSNFALTRSEAVLRAYRRITPLVSLIIVVTSVCPLIGAMYPDSGQLWQIVFSGLIVFKALIFCIFGFVSIVYTNQDLRKALMNPTLKTHSCLDNRIRRFARKARFIMTISMALTLIQLSYNFSTTVCDSCADYLWIFIPFTAIMTGVFAIRNMITSIHTSKKYAGSQSITEQQHRNVLSSSEKAYIDPKASVEFRKVHVTKTKRKSGKKKAVPRPVKNMTAVPESEHEGTVVFTNVGSLQYVMSGHPMSTAEEEGDYEGNSFEPITENSAEKKTSRV